MPTFNPPDHELIKDYLNYIIIGNYYLSAEGEINVLNICHHEPSDIPGLVRIESNHTWYFISPVEKLNGRCGRTKRSSKTGHWKITGRNTNVKDIDGNIIGFKKILVFHENKEYSSSSSSSSLGTRWTIHEIHSFLQHPNKDAFVLCKLMRRPPTSQNGVGDASPVVTTDPPPILTSDSSPQKDNIVLEDYCENLDDIIPGFQSTNLLDQPQYSYYSQQYEDLYSGNFIGTTQSRERGESSSLCFEEIGQVYGQTTMENSKDLEEGEYWNSVRQ